MSPVHRWDPPGTAPPVGKYSQLASPAVGTRLVFVSGQVGNEPDGRLAGGVRAQTRRALENVAALAATFGASPDDFVRLVTFVVGADSLPEYFDARDEVYAQWFPSGLWCGHTLAVVAGLASPDLRVEVEAVVAVAAGALQDGPATGGAPGA